MNSGKKPFYCGLLLIAVYIIAIYDCQQSIVSHQQALLLFNWKLMRILADNDQEIAGDYDEFDRDDNKLYNSADLLAAAAMRSCLLNGRSRQLLLFLLPMRQFCKRRNPFNYML